LGFLISWGITVIIVLQSPRGESVGISNIKSSFNYFINQIHVICHYLKLTFYPLPLNIDYGIPTHYTIFETIFPFIILSSLFFSIPILFWRKNLLIAYSLLSFFVILSPTSTFVPISTEVAADRRMYLAVIPLLIIIFAIVVVIMNRSKERLSPLLTAVIYAGVLITFSCITYLRTLDYQDNLRIWRHSTKVLPRNPRSWNSCGLILLDRGQLIEAESALRRSLSLNSNYKNALINMGVIQFRNGDYHRAIQYFKKALKIDPDNVSIYLNIGTAYGELNNCKGLKYYKKALKLSPQNYNIAFRIAILYMKLKQNKEAEKYFLNALNRSQNNTLILAGVGEFYCQSEDYSKGIFYLKQAQKQSPNNIKITNMIKKYRKLSK
jgi:Tfp pilus assembly protein PilF